MAITASIHRQAQQKPLQECGQQARQFGREVLTWTATLQRCMTEVAGTVTESSHRATCSGKLPVKTFTRQILMREGFC